MASIPPTPRLHCFTALTSKKMVAEDNACRELFTLKKKAVTSLDFQLSCGIFLQEIPLQHVHSLCEQPQCCKGSIMHSSAEEGRFFWVETLWFAHLFFSSERNRGEKSLLLQACRGRWKTDAAALLAKFGDGAEEMSSHFLSWGISKFLPACHLSAAPSPASSFLLRSSPL